MDQLREPFEGLVKRPSQSETVEYRTDRPMPPGPSEGIELVRRPGMAGLASVVKDRTGQEYTTYPLSFLLQMPLIRGKLLQSNLLIIGIVGYYDIICNALTQVCQEEQGKSVKTHHTSTWLREPRGTIKEEANFTRVPIILIPTVENSAELNRIVVKGLKTKHPIWLVAFPALLERQLLLSFNGFFLFPGSTRDLSIITDITPINKLDIDRLNRGEVKSILSLDTHYPEISLKERLGTVSYLGELDGLS